MHTASPRAHTHANNRAKQKRVKTRTCIWICTAARALCEKKNRGKKGTKIKVNRDYLKLESGAPFTRMRSVPVIWRAARLLLLVCLPLVGARGVHVRAEKSPRATSTRRDGEFSFRSAQLCSASCHLFFLSFLQNSLLFTLVFLTRDSVINTCTA